MVERTHDIGRVLACEEQFDSGFDRGVNEQSLGLKFRGATRDAVDERILTLKRFDERVFLFVVRNNDLHVGSVVVGRKTNDGCEMEFAVL